MTREGLGRLTVAYAASSQAIIYCLCRGAPGWQRRHPSRNLNGWKSYHGKKERSRNYDVIDFIWPKGNPWDTRSGNSKGVDEDLRAHQLDLRLAEIEEGLKLYRQSMTAKGNIKQELTYAAL